MTLTPQLVGLEGKRVEVVDKFGNTRRFWVSSNHESAMIRVHLELKLANSSGGFAADHEYASVRVVPITKYQRDYAARRFNRHPSDYVLRTKGTHHAYTYA